MVLNKLGPSAPVALRESWAGASACYLVAIDGGGSSLRLLLADGDGRSLGTGSAGSADFVELGKDRFLAHLETAWQRARSGQDAKVRVAGVWAGLGCVITERDASDARSLLRSFRPFAESDIHCVNDSVIAREGAHGGRPGLHLIAGTGSVCLGKSRSGELARVGGLGPLFDDQGSGYAIGRAALARAAAGADGRLPDPAWRARLFDRLGVAEASAVYRRVHGDADPRGLIASLAPLVFDEAESGDADAVVILNHATADLAALVAACARRLGMDAPAVTMSGSIVERRPDFRDCVVCAVNNKLPGAMFPKSAGAPIKGALLLARNNHSASMKPTTHKSSIP